MKISRIARPAFVAACALAVAATPFLMTRANAQKADKAQDSTVEGVTVTGAMAPVPDVGDGAPLYTVEELAAEQKAARLDASDAGLDARLCDPYSLGDRLSFGQVYRAEQAAQRAVQTAAERAEAATAASTAVRVAAAQGKASQKEVEDAELARQAAVKILMAKRSEVNEARARTSDYQQVIDRVNRCDIPEALIQGEFAALTTLRPPADKIGITIPESLKDLVLSDVQADELNDGKIMRVTGKINNPRDKAIEIPSLAFTAVDQFNFAIRTEITSPQKNKKIPPRSSVPFSYDFAPMPGRTKTVVAAVSNARYALTRYPAGMFCERTNMTPLEAMRAVQSKPTPELNIHRDCDQQQQGSRAG